MAIAFLALVFLQEQPALLSARARYTVTMQRFYLDLFAPDASISSTLAVLSRLPSVYVTYCHDSVLNFRTSLENYFSTPLTVIALIASYPRRAQWALESWPNFLHSSSIISNRIFLSTRDYFFPPAPSLYDISLYYAQTTVAAARYSVVHPLHSLLGLAAAYELLCMVCFRRRSAIINKAVFGWLFDLIGPDPEPLPAGQSTLPAVFYATCLKSLSRDNADRTLVTSNSHGSFGAERCDIRDDIMALIKRLGFHPDEVYVIHAGNRRIAGLRFQYSYSAKCHNYKNHNETFCPYRLAHHPSVKLVIVENCLYYLDLKTLLKCLKTILSSSWNPTYVGQSNSELIVSAHGDEYEFVFAGGDRYRHRQYNCSQTETVFHYYPVNSQNYESYRSPLQRFAEYFFPIGKYCVTYRIDRQESPHTTFCLFTPIRVSATEFLPEKPVPFMRLTYTIPPHSPGNNTDQPYSFFALRVNSHYRDAGELTVHAESTRSHGYLLGYPGSGTRVFIRENSLHALRQDPIAGASGPAKMLQIFKESSSHATYTLQFAAATLLHEIDKHAYTSAFKPVYSQIQLPPPPVRPIPPYVPPFSIPTMQQWLITLDGPYPEPVFELSADLDETTTPEPIAPPPPSPADIISSIAAANTSPPSTSWSDSVASFYNQLDGVISSWTAGPSLPTLSETILLHTFTRTEPEPTDDIIKVLGLDGLVQNLSKAEKQRQKDAQDRYALFNHTQQHQHHAPLAPNEIPYDIIPSMHSIHPMIFFSDNALLTKGAGPSLDAVVNRFGNVVKPFDVPRYSDIVNTVILTACTAIETLHMAMISAGHPLADTRSIQEIIDDGGQLGKRATEYLKEFNEGTNHNTVTTSTAFTKVEPTRKKVSDAATRNISAAPTAHVVGLSQVSNGLKQFLYHTFQGAAFQYSNRDAGLLVHHMATNFSRVLESDFSKYDGTQNLKPYIIETFAHILTSADPAFSLELKRSHTNLSYRTGPYVYRPAFSRQSGAADTSLSNTLINAMVHVLANLYSPLIASNPNDWYLHRPDPSLMRLDSLQEICQRCIVAGDDGMYYDTSRESLEAIAWVLGLTAKLEEKSTSEPCTLLARVYPCPAASGASGADLKRTLQNLSTAQIRSYLTPLQQISNKVLSYSLTDLATPIIGQVLGRIQETINHCYGDTIQLFSYLHPSDFPYTLKSGQGIPLGPIEQQVYLSLYEPDVIDACTGFFSAPSLQAAYAGLPIITPPPDDPYSVRYEHLKQSRRKQAHRKREELVRQYGLDPTHLAQIPIHHWDQASSTKTNARLNRLLQPHDIQHLHDLTPATLSTTLALSRFVAQTTAHTPHYELMPVYEQLLANRNIDLKPYPDHSGHVSNIFDLAQEIVLADPDCHVFIDLPFEQYEATHTPGHADFIADVSTALSLNHRILLLVPTCARDLLMGRTDRQRYTSAHVKGDAHLILPRLPHEPLYVPTATGLIPIEIPYQPTKAEIAHADGLLQTALLNTLSDRSHIFNGTVISIAEEPDPGRPDMPSLLAAAAANPAPLILKFHIPSSYKPQTFDAMLLNNVRRRVGQTTAPKQPGAPEKLLAACRTYLLASSQNVPGFPIPDQNSPLHLRLLEANKHNRINNLPHLILVPTLPSPTKQ